jgi:hypothetical protein
MTAPHHTQSKLLHRPSKCTRNIQSVNYGEDGIKAYFSCIIWDKINAHTKTRIAIASAYRPCFLKRGQPTKHQFYRKQKTIFNLLFTANELFELPNSSFAIKRKVSSISVFCVSCRIDVSCVRIAF